MDLQRLHGIVPPILTPLNDDETVDTDSMKALVEHVISNGCHGIWVTGTTGEFPCLDEKQRAIAVQTAVEAANGRVPVVAGIGDASTNLAVRHAKNAKSAGADFIALVPPYYYLNSQDEQLTHYRSMRERVDMPLMVYNIPQTVKIKLDVKTVLTLLEEGVIMGLKDSQNDLDWFRQVMIGAKRLDKPFRAFLGTRYLIDAGTIVGAHGSIPSIANVAPAISAAVYERSIAGDWAGADRAQTKLGELALRVPSVPAMKAALVAQGVLKSPRMTLPFKTFSSAEVEKIGKLVAEVGLNAD